MFSQEFFLQRSFEVVWAVFRVAEHTSRPKIRQALEDKAVDYLVAKNLETLNGLEEIIRLSAQINEINKINSAVLLREIRNLRSAILDFQESQRRALLSSKNPETAPNLEESFSRPPMLLSQIIKTISDSINKSQEAGIINKSDANEEKVRQGIDKKSGKEDDFQDKSNLSSSYQEKVVENGNFSKPKVSLASDNESPGKGKPPSFN
jgi:hypothetical protein